MPLKNYFFIFYKFNFENAKLKYQRRFEERICASNFSFFFHCSYTWKQSERNEKKEALNKQIDIRPRIGIC